MNVIVKLIHRGIKVACLVEVKPKTYRIVDIPQLDYMNNFYSSRVNKSDDIVITKFTPKLLSQIKKINALDKECDKEIEAISETYQAKCIEIFDQIIKSSKPEKQ